MPTQNLRYVARALEDARLVLERYIGIENFNPRRRAHRCELVYSCAPDAEPPASVVHYRLPGGSLATGVPTLRKLLTAERGNMACSKEALALLMLWDTLNHLRRQLEREATGGTR